MRVLKLKFFKLPLVYWLIIVTFSITLLIAILLPIMNSVPPSIPPINPRADLLQAGLGNVPLVDAVTPIPDMAGSSELYVDGVYFSHAPTGVADFVVSVAESGIPIVVLGTGLEDVGEKLKEKFGTRLSMSVTGGLSSVSDDGVRTPLPIYGAAIKLYPENNGRFLVSIKRISGDYASGDYVIKDMQEWLERQGDISF